MPLELSTRFDAALQSPAADLLVVLLKAAREATDDVPIVKQILGAAVHIVEFAQKIKDNSDALFSLAEMSATWAGEINDVVKRHAVESDIERRLQRLYGVFNAIEAFMKAESAITSRPKRAYRNRFVVPKHVERLSQLLDREVKGFLLWASVLTTVRVEADARYDGQIRRLRQCDIHVREFIRTISRDETRVYYAKAVVDGELMVVRYAESISTDEDRRGNSGLQERTSACETGQRELINILTSTRIPHPFIVQIYGRGTSGYGSPPLLAMRAGTTDLLSAMRNTVPALPRTCLGDSTFNLDGMLPKILDAAAYLRYDLGILWKPNYLEDIGLDSNGQVTIGFVDSLIYNYSTCCEVEASEAVNGTIRAIMSGSSLLRGVHSEWHGRVAGLCDGWLGFMLMQSVEDRSSEWPSLPPLISQLLEVDVRITQYTRQFPTYPDDNHAPSPKAQRYYADIDNECRDLSWRESDLFEQYYCAPQYYPLDRQIVDIRISYEARFGIADSIEVIRTWVFADVLYREILSASIPDNIARPIRMALLPDRFHCIDDTEDEPRDPDSLHPIGFYPIHLADWGYPQLHEDSLEN